MTILADYMIPTGATGGGAPVRKIQGRIVLAAGVAVQAMPPEFANAPADWPVMVTRVNPGTAEGELLAGFDPAGPEINFASTEVTDDATLTFTMEIPTSLLG